MQTQEENIKKTELYIATYSGQEKKAKLAPHRDDMPKSLVCLPPLRSASSERESGATMYTYLECRANSAPWSWTMQQPWKEALSSLHILGKETPEGWSCLISLPSILHAQLPLPSGDSHSQH